MRLGETIAVLERRVELFEVLEAASSRDDARVRLREFGGGGSATIEYVLDLPLFLISTAGRDALRERHRELLDRLGEGPGSEPHPGASTSASPDATAGSVPGPVRVVPVAGDALPPLAPVMNRLFWGRARWDGLDADRLAAASEPWGIVISALYRPWAIKYGTYSSPELHVRVDGRVVYEQSHLTYRPEDAAVYVPLEDRSNSIEIYHGRSRRKPDQSRLLLSVDVRPRPTEVLVLKISPAFEAFFGLRRERTTYRLEAVNPT